MALARLDSLSGGRVFGPKPIQWGLTIDGGFSRSGRRNSGGVLAADSSSLKATIDSLNALDIPAVLNVNVDSIGAYPSEKGWWTRWRKLRFAPQTRLGIDSTAAGLGNSSWLRPVDPWGRWRQRVAYQGSNCTGAADTSTYCGLRSGFFRLDSVPEFKGRMSRFLSAPDDDWTSVNAPFRARGIDSVLFAASMAGASGIRINSQVPQNGAFRVIANPRGWWGRQGYYNVLGQDSWALINDDNPNNDRTSNTGRRMKLLAHSGYSIAGGQLQADVRSDSTAPFFKALVDYPWITIPSYELHRIWNAGLYQQYKDRDVMTDFQISTGADADAPWNGVNKPIQDQIYFIHHGNIIRMSAQEFAGDASNLPARPGWWTLKSLVHAQRVINRLANRNIVGMAYPEDLVP